MGDGAQTTKKAVNLAEVSKFRKVSIPDKEVDAITSRFHIAMTQAVELHMQQVLKAHMDKIERTSTPSYWIDKKVNSLKNCCGIKYPDEKKEGIQKLTSEFRHNLKDSLVNY